MSRTTEKDASKVTSTVLEHVRQILVRNRAGERLGTYAVCSAHPVVIEASIRQAMEDASILHVESTSSQVNQFGGYTGVTPEGFAQRMWAEAERAGLPRDRVLLGADHLGPFPWKNESSAAAIAKGCELARASVHAGYHKIHLDASVACADDGVAINEAVVAERAAVLCEAAEEEVRRLGRESRPLYVIGTEVPAPGGEVAEGEGPTPTKIEDVRRTLELFQRAFAARGLSEAWENVIALVVQPGVEFGDAVVFNYERKKAAPLANGLPADSPLVYEAHSTDYQQPHSLGALVEDHFAILKVGPWLTFAYREVIFALEMIEHELLHGRKDVQLSRVREVLDEEMIRNPVYWKSYYKGGDEEAGFARAFSLSDRCRYYWPQPAIQQEIAVLIKNLSAAPVPLTLISQYLPVEYEAVRNGEIVSRPGEMIQHRIRDVLKKYAVGCGVRSKE